MVLGQELREQAHIGEQPSRYGRQRFAGALQTIDAAFDQNDVTRRREVQGRHRASRAGAYNDYIDRVHSDSAPKTMREAPHLLNAAQIQRVGQVCALWYILEVLHLH